MKRLVFLPIIFVLGIAWQIISGHQAYTLSALRTAGVQFPADARVRYEEMRSSYPVCIANLTVGGDLRMVRTQLPGKLTADERGQRIRFTTRSTDVDLRSTARADEWSVEVTSVQNDGLFCQCMNGWLCSILP
jgi:hypothetical protein